MTAPTFISATATANSIASPKTTPSIAVQNGDILVAYGYGENGNMTVSIATASGSTSAWILQRDTAVASMNNPYLRMWSAIATATGNITVTFTTVGGLFNLGVVKVWRNSTGIGNTNRNDSGVTAALPTVSITTTGANSGLDFANNDWSGKTGAVTFTASNGTPVSDLSDQTHPANYCIYSAHVLDAGSSGVKTFGMSTPTAQRYICDAIEIMGSVAASVTPFVPTMRQYMRLGATGGGGSAPVVTPTNFTVPANPALGQFVGTVSATNSPTSFAIIAGNTGNFVIASNGNLSVASSGSPPAAGNYSLSVTATNATGTSAAATIGVTVQSASGGITIPMSKSDSRFASNTGGGGFPNTGTVTNKNFDESPGYANGDACVVWAPTGAGTLTVSKCIFDWREGPRFQSASNTKAATIIFDQCWFNCVGKTTDHADAWQAFSSPAGSMTIRFTNCYFRAYSDSTAVSTYGSGFIAATAGFFADGAMADIFYDNCLVWADNQGFRIFADQGITNLSITNSFLAGGGKCDAASTGGTLNVTAWTNNRLATVSGGVITPGATWPQSSLAL